MPLTDATDEQNTATAKVADVSDAALVKSPRAYPDAGHGALFQYADEFVRT